MNNKKFNLEISKLAVQGLDLLQTAHDAEENLLTGTAKKDTVSLLEEYSEQLEILQKDQELCINDGYSTPRISDRELQLIDLREAITGLGELAEKYFKERIRNHEV